MSSRSLAEFSELLLGLYRQAQERPLHEFQDAALASLKTSLSFESAMWGTAGWSPQGIDIHHLHLHRQPVEMLAAYERIKHLDTAAAEVAGQGTRCTQGFHAPSWFGDPGQAAIRDYGRRFEQSNFFITSDLNPATGMVQWVTLFRARDAQHCLPRECEWLSLMAPHLMQALSFNRQAHLQATSPDSRSARGVAIADARGCFYHQDALFRALVYAEWGGHAGGRLSDAACAALREEAARYVGQHLVIEGRYEHGLWFLRGRPRCLADSLTAREQWVAQGVAQGHTYKQLAAQSGRSPATVRNQIQAIYEKLAVHGVAGLIARLREQD